MSLFAPTESPAAAGSPAPVPGGKPSAGGPGTGKPRGPYKKTREALAQVGSSPVGKSAKSPAPSPVAPPPDPAILNRKCGYTGRLFGQGLARVYDCDAGLFSEEEEKLWGEALADVFRGLGLDDSTVVNLSLGIAVLGGIAVPKIAVCRRFAYEEAARADAEARAKQPSHPSPAAPSTIPPRPAASSPDASKPGGVPEKALGLIGGVEKL